MERLRVQIKELGDKNRMQLEQINVLLLEKVSLQSDGIGQREKMIQRERDFGYVNLMRRFPPSLNLRLFVVYQRFASDVLWERYS